MLENLTLRTLWLIQYLHLHRRHILILNQNYISDRLNLIQNLFWNRKLEIERYSFFLFNILCLSVASDLVGVCF